MTPPSGSEVSFFDTNSVPFFRAASGASEAWDGVLILPSRESCVQDVSCSLGLSTEDSIVVPSDFREDPAADMPVSGNIHCPEYDAFWNDNLNPDSWVRSVRKDGYKLPFREFPSHYEEKNNKTARDDLSYVRDAIGKLLAKVSVKKLHCKPTCVNPRARYTAYR